MPVPRHVQLERLLHTLRESAEGRFQVGVERAIDSLAEDLAGGDAASGFKWLCNDLEDMASEGFPITGAMYAQIEETGKSLRAPERQWKVLLPYVK